MSDEERARVELIDVCRRLYEKGWVANHDGNLSVRVGEDRIVTTPTAVNKGDVRPEMLIVVDMAGKKLEGTRKPFSELSLHLKAYRARPDVKAVLHAHPVTATGFAVAGVDVDPRFMPEAVVSLGPRIPTAPLALPYGEEGAAVLDGLVDDYDVVLLENHGVISFGPDLMTAFYRMELVEHLAKIQLVASQIGRVQPLSEAHLAKLMERRKAAGLGPEARAGSKVSDPWNTSGGGSGGSSSGSSSGWSSSSANSGGWGSGGRPQIPEGAAPSAWGGPDPVSSCSGERIQLSSLSGGASSSASTGPFSSGGDTYGASTGMTGASGSGGSRSDSPSGSSSDSSAGSRALPSNEELEQLLAREVTRILGKK